MQESLDSVIKKFKLLDIIYKSPNDLTTNQKTLLCLASALIHEPKILILDESLQNFDPCEKDRIFKLLKTLKNKGVTILMITQDIEDTIICDEVVVINDKKVVMKGTKEELYEEEKLLNKLGYKLPFMVELSNRLKFYNLIDENIYDMEKLVDTLWQ